MLCQAFPRRQNRGLARPPTPTCYERLCSCYAQLRAIFHLFRFAANKLLTKQITSDSVAWKEAEQAKICISPCFSRDNRWERRSCRPVSRDCVHHQEVGANCPGFPAPTIPRLFSAFSAEANGLRGLFCRDDGAWAGERGNESPTPNFGFPTAPDWTDQRDREPFALQSGFGGRP